MPKAWPLLNWGPKREARECFVRLRQARDAMNEGPWEDKCSEFLAQVEGLQKALRIAKASRSYRVGFSRNYRQLLRDEERRYRVDLLEAALDKPDPLHVNDVRFDWDPQVTTEAEALERAWEELFEAIRDGQDERGLVPVLEGFDAAFASFEKEYLFFLIRTEASCKFIVKTAVERAQLVRYGAAQAEQRLVATLCELNGRANTLGKGRQDLGLEILHTARAHSDGALSVLCRRVLASFDDAIMYFESIGAAADGLDRIDPQLARNQKLVACLVEWEEAWEAAKRYLCPPSIREAMARFVADLRLVARNVPRFSDMLTSSDVEVFALLPQMFVAFCSEAAEGRDLLKLVCEDADVVDLSPSYEGYFASMTAVARGEVRPNLREAGFTVQRQNAPSWNLFLGALAREVVGERP